ncbi:inorganic anion transporter, sulfate permease (SulP) subfamily protein [Acanthamoeba castellanii str. Neff]|uniref:Inorganic anion transporter, sulfate permease (SulP) subfamily protein n=1 Tax=Acanthamoeba castellanii (strain ATCC 30010 / Neff) TaxID=1257118 RepID=L8GXT0_ACACF|nr:inorganic anion transporter, sulfate permease (SulP) subfamily protein [Acanthamoeba castellanii str. Neff]ELR18054.1 inorganic anion transporter, sulfate permease (SulP) subfamily protein [Acanthamoeba castellanii str. Neff]
MSLHQTAHLIDAAVVISIVGFVESVVVAKEFSAKHHYQVSSNRELLALGASNIVASFFRSFPTFGSLPRSGVANATGAKTPLAGLFTALVLGICIQFLIPTFAYMPRVIMAAVIFRASLLLIEEHEIIYMFKVRAWNDASIMVIVGILTFLLGIEKGIIIAIGISIFMVVKRTTLPRLAVLLRTPTGKFKSKEESDQGQPIDGVLLVRLEENYLYYANIGQTQALLTRQVEEALMDARNMQRGDESNSEPTLCVIINMKWVENMDVSSQLAVESLVEEFHARSIGLFLVRLNTDLRVRFERSGLVAKLGSDHLCLTNALAIQAAIDWRRQMEKNAAHELP